MTAQYLLRFDDLCPTMDKERWQRFVPMLRRHGVQPILAVVPDNQDRDLKIDPPDPEFWAEMRDWQAAGAAIGLHGYQHVCAANGPGLLPIHRVTEFAGTPLETQRAWIRAGMEILTVQGLRPSIWVAPRHGLDWNTLVALGELGLPVVSDGFARGPFRRDGATWIPQQLWGPVEKSSGVWTICLHANTASDAAVVELASFLDRFATRFTSVDRVLAEWPVSERSLEDRWMGAYTMTRIRLGRLGHSLGLR